MGFDPQAIGKGPHEGPLFIKDNHVGSPDIEKKAIWMNMIFKKKTGGARVVSACLYCWIDFIPLIGPVSMESLSPVL